MIKKIDKERVMGIIRQEQSVTDFFTGAGTGIVVSCLLSPNSEIRTAAILIGLVMVGIGWYRKAIYDKKVINFLNEQNDM